MKLDSSQIHDQVRKRFAEVASRPEAEKRFKLTPVVATLPFKAGPQIRGAV